MSKVRGYGATISATSLIDPALLAFEGVDYHVIQVDWRLLDPTKTDGTRLNATGVYLFSGNTPAGAIASETASAQLRILANLQAIGAAGRKAIIEVDAGLGSPKYVIGAPVGDADFGSGLPGLSPGMKVANATQNGGNPVHTGNNGKVWDSAYQTPLIAMINGLATFLHGTFVSGSSGPTLYDILAAVHINGINLDTGEIRMAAEWPQLICTSTHGLGTPDCTTPGVTDAPYMWAQNGYKPSLVAGAMDTIREAWRAAFPDKTLQHPIIVGGANSSGFPAVAETGNLPLAVIDTAATAAANSGHTYTKVPTIVIDPSKFPAGQSMADFPDPAVTGVPGTIMAPRTGGGNHLVAQTYESIDYTNHKFLNVKGGTTGQQFLAPLTISGKSNAAWGGVQLTVSSTSTWGDGTRGLISGLAGSLGADLNGKVVTVRIIDGTHVTLTAPDGTPVTSSNAWTSGGTVNPLTCPGLDTAMAELLVRNNAAALGAQMMAMHQSVDATGVEDYLAMVASWGYGVQIGGQLDEGAYGTQGTNAAATTTTASSGGVPSSAVPITKRTFFTGTAPYQITVDGHDTTVTGPIVAGAGALGTIPIDPPVPYASGARVSWAPSVLSAAQNAVNQDLTYMEGFPYTNVDDDTFQAHLLLLGPIGGSTTILPIPELVILVYRADGTPAEGQLLVTQLEFIERYLALGSWTLTAPFDGDLNSPAGVLLSEGSFIVILIGGVPEFGGPMTKSLRVRDGDLSTVQVGGTDDLQAIVDRLAHQDPANADTAADGATHTYAASDDQVGPAETVLKHYVDVNCGPGAVTARQVAGLTIESDMAQGAVVSASARGQGLLDFLVPLATVGGVGFRMVRTSPTTTQFNVYVPPDKSRSVTFAVELGNLKGYQFGTQRPTGNLNYVGGSGTAAARVFEVVEDTDSQTAWGSRIERFNDQGSTADPDQLLTAGLADLATVAAQFFFSATTVDTKAHEWAPLVTDSIVTPYKLGDIVSVIADGQRISEQIREIDVVYAGDGTVTVTPSVGSTSQSGRPEQLFYEAFVAVVRQQGIQIRELQRR